MGNCDRPAILDLPLENGNHRTVGTQHVTETGRDKLGVTVDLSLDLGLVETLDIDLTNPLGATHDVGRVDSLVGRDHNELPDTVFD